MYMKPRKLKHRLLKIKHKSHTNNKLSKPCMYVQRETLPVANLLTRIWLKSL